MLETALQSGKADDEVAAGWCVWWGFRGYYVTGYRAH
jgi:hypothetical protein